MVSISGDLGSLFGPHHVGLDGYRLHCILIPALQRTIGLHCASIRGTF
jgi:hypothetical protein